MSGAQTASAQSIGGSGRALTVVRALRRHAAFLILLAAGGALRVLVVMAYPPIFMFQRDTYTYLHAALAERLQPAGFRPLMYPILFVKPLLMGDSLLLVAVAQHVLGLGVAVLIYACLRRLELSPGLAALATAPILLDGYQLSIEHYLLSEALFQALVVGGLALLLWGPRPALAATAVAGILLGLSTVTRFVGGVVIVAALVYCVVARVGWARIGTLVAAFLVPLAAYSAWYESALGTYGITNRNGFFLYGRVSSFADCSKIDPPPNLRRFCLDKPPAERERNFGIFALSSVDLGELVRSKDANARLFDFSRAAIVAQPLDYARTVMADFGRFFSPMPPPEQEPYVKRWRFPLTVRDADPRPSIARFKGSAPPRLGLQPFEIDASLASALREYQSVGYTPGPLLGLLALLGLIGSALPGGARRRRTACLLFTLAGAFLLLAPVMTSVYHFRYSIAALPLLGPAGALGASLAGARLRRLRRSDAP
jgi:hypothetical protein